MIRLPRSSAFVALAVILLASCSERIVAPPPQATLDSLLLDLNSGATYAASGVGLLGAPVPSSSSNAPAPCEYQADTQRFVCPTFVTPFGTEISRWFQLLDASGTPLSHYDRATVAAVKTVVDIVSNRPMPAGPGMPAGTVHETTHSEQVLSGLLTNARTLNGTSHSTMTMTVGTYAPRTFTVSQATTNLVLPTEPGGYPKSGSVTTEVTAPDFTGTGTFTRTMTMTFNGTSIVTLTVTMNGTTSTCQVDLSQPTGFGSCALFAQGVGADKGNGA